MSARSAERIARVGGVLDDLMEREGLTIAVLAAIDEHGTPVLVSRSEDVLQSVLLLRQASAFLIDDKRN